MSWKLLITIVGFIASGCILLNMQAERINTLTNTNKKLIAVLEEQKAINTDYQLRIERLNQLDTRHTQDLVNAKNEISRLRNISERIPERVYIRASCPKIEPNPTTRLDDATATRPTDIAIRNYWLLRERIAESEQMILGLQGYIRLECLR